MDRSQQFKAPEMIVLLGKLEQMVKEGADEQALENAIRFELQGLARTALATLTPFERIALTEPN